MELRYSLEQNDYLLHQLYYSSKNKRIKRQRLRSWIFMVVIFLGLSLIFLKENKVLFYYFLITSGLVLFFFPFYQKFYYRRHYKRFVSDTYKNVFGKENSIKFTDSHIEMITDVSSGNFNYSVLEEINEIQAYYFLKMNTGLSLIIPKTAIHNSQEFKDILFKLKKQYNLKENIELDWKWK